MIIYSQGNSYTCQQYACFGIVGRNFGKYLPQKSVDKWIKKKNLKDPKTKGGLGSIEVAEIIAKEIGKKVVTFGFRDKDFYKYWNEGKGIGISLQAPAEFYRDTMDGVLNSYIHPRGNASHAVYIYKPGILVNSVGETIPPATFDLEKFQTKWLKNTLCFTII